MPTNRIWTKASSRGFQYVKQRPFFLARLLSRDVKKEKFLNTIRLVKAIMIVHNVCSLNAIEDYLNPIFTSQYHLYGDGCSIVYPAFPL